VSTIFYRNYTLKKGNIETLMFWLKTVFYIFHETLKNFVGFANNSEFVMPDLIRHPEFAEVTGFRPSPE
jgi:hypothetical protein